MFPAKQLCVLVVDDTSTSRMLVRDALERMGIAQIMVAGDGLEALQCMAGRRCHLVVADFNMPRMDGLELLRVMRSNRTTRDTPFIILTGNGDRALLQKAAMMGANNYLTKPFTLHGLKAAIEAVVGTLQ